MKTISECGEIFQIAYVADNLERAIGFWTGRMGVGPFFLMENIPFEKVTYRGQPIDIDLTVAIAYWGNTQIEFICQNNDVPSIYSSCKDRHGVHHMCMVVDEMKAARDIFVHAGAEIVQEGRLSGGLQFFYADTGGGPIIEAITLPSDYREVFEFVRSAALNWDGEEPMRRL